MTSFKQNNGGVMNRVTSTRARGGGVLGDALVNGNPWLRERLSAELARIEQREQEKAAKRRVMCGAKTRKGSPCRNMSEPGKTRCKFHGGKSTGPKTAEGKTRIAEAQRRRWAKYRAQCPKAHGRQKQSSQPEYNELHS